MSVSNSSTSRLQQSNLASRLRPTDVKELPEEDSRKSLIAVIAQMSTVWMISMVLHVLLIIGLALYTLVQVAKDDPISLAVDVVRHEEIETMVAIIAMLKLVLKGSP